MDVGEKDVLGGRNSMSKGSKTRKCILFENWPSIKYN